MEFIRVCHSFQRSMECLLKGTMKLILKITLVLLAAVILRSAFKLISTNLDVVLHYLDEAVRCTQEFVRWLIS